MRITLKLWIAAAMLGASFYARPACADSSAPAFSLDHRPDGISYVYDYTRLIPADNRTRLQTFLDLLYKDENAELVGVLVESLGTNDIDAWTNQLFEKWMIGKKTGGNRGLLLVVVRQDKQVRLEVGNGLEGVLTDAFIGYIEQNQMKPFFEAGRVGDGFEATLELVVERLRKGAQSGADAPDVLAPTDYLSSGAGARRDIDIGSVDTQPKPAVADDVRSYFSAQQTPEGTLKRYLEASRRHIKDPNLGIYTDATKEFFRNWVVTDAQQDSDTQFDNAPFTLKTEGEYAVIYYPDKDLTYNPFFLRRGSEGWQLDFATMTKVIRFNQHNFWRFVEFEHPYMFAFKLYPIDKNGFVSFQRKDGSQRGFLNITYTTKDGPIEVTYVAPGGASEQAGLRAGDQITHVNGKEVKAVGIAEARKEMSGAIGTTVTLRVMRPSENRSLDISIMREGPR